MKTVLITGSAGLVGSESVKFFVEKGFNVVGIDNDMRKYFFGPEASTKHKIQELSEYKMFKNHEIDIRDYEELEKIFAWYSKDIVLVIHTAAQPSHDWAAKEPLTDFSVNATGTMNLLELTRKHCPEAVFIFTSTNKVYGDRPNRLPIIYCPTRWELNPDHPFSEFGIDESMSIDRTKHSVFGASKVAADIMVQEYGKYFGMKTGIFRGGCLTGPAHAGAELHGFLSYLMKCAMTNKTYRIIGYEGKQVRDNIHSEDLVNAFWYFFNDPKPGKVFNIGGGRTSNCSVIEAIKLCESIVGRKMNTEYVATPRIGDHIWWVSDTRKFSHYYPKWKITKGIEDILVEISNSQK
jgi:CDP-paratose 2-epimerase